MSKMRRILALILVAMFVLSACGSSETTTTEAPKAETTEAAKADTTEAAKTDTTAAPAETTEASGGEKVSPTGSIFRFTQTIMPKWDPAVGSDYSSNVMLINCYDSLVWPTSDGDVQPWVADSWEFTDEGKTVTFKIHEGITFHSGNTLTAADVKYSIDRLCTIGEGYAHLFIQYIDNVEAPDDTTCIFHLTQAYGPLLNNLVRLYIVDSQTIEANIVADGTYGDKGDYGKAYLIEHDAGSGPYIVDEIVTNTSVTCKKYDAYWRGLDPNVPEKYVEYASNDGVTVKTMMARQELECCDMWQTAENIKSMMDSDPTLQLAYNYTGGGINLWMNNQREPLDDPQVREALGYLMDYGTVCNNILPDSKQKMSVIPSNLLGYKQVFDFSFDLAKAQDAISRSTHANDIGNYEIECIWNSESADREKVALMIQAAAAQIGINIKIVELPWSTIVANSADVNTSPMMTLTSITPTTADSGAQFVSLLRTKEIGTWENMNWVNDPELDKMIDEALAISDNAERAKAYEAIQDYCGERFTFVPIAESPERLLYQASYVEMAPSIGLQGFSFDFREIRVYPERRADAQ